MTTTAEPFKAGTRSAEGGHGRRLWPRRDRDGDPAWARPAFAGLLVATAALYLIGLGRSGWANDFYAAAVQAGTKSWKAMFFGSFDASNFITVDKPPAALWVSEVSARIFGLNSWSLLVPQAFEGVAAVGLLYRTVKRWFGPGAGLLAGAVLATTPVATLMFRFNNPDALLVLLIVAAAYAVTRAIEDGRTRWLVLAGSLVGFGFLTKMLQAFLVLPAFGIAYLVAGPPRLGRRLWQLVVGGLATLVAAGWWVAIVELTPASARPYIGGSTTNSVLQLAFGYNGLGRITGNETGSVGFGGGTGSPFGGAPRLTRLFGAEMGGQASWLIPAALVALAALMWATRRAPRNDHTRAAALLWGGWLLVTGAVFSFMAGIIHPYYTVALAPAIGALVGIGGSAAWHARRHLSARIMLAVMVAVGAIWPVVLLDRSPGWYPWLRGLIVAAGLAAVLGLFAEQPVIRRLGAAVSRGTASAAAAGVMSLALVGALAGPVACSLETAATPHAGAIPSAGPAVTTAAGGPGGFGGRARPGPRWRWDHPKRPGRSRFARQPKCRGQAGLGCGHPRRSACRRPCRARRRVRGWTRRRGPGQQRHGCPAALGRVRLQLGRGHRGRDVCLATAAVIRRTDHGHRRLQRH